MLAPSAARTNAARRPAGAEAEAKAEAEVGPWLHVEYNTLRILPASGMVVLTMRSLREPLQALYTKENGADLARALLERASA